MRKCTYYLLSFKAFSKLLSTTQIKSNQKSPFIYLHMLNVAQPAAAAAIDRYLLSTEPTAANLQKHVCCWGPMLEQTDGQTDWWTPYRFTDGTMWAVPKSYDKLSFSHLLCNFATLSSEHLPFPVLNTGPILLKKYRHKDVSNHAVN